MRVSLTKYGLPQVVVLPAIVVAAMVILILVSFGSLPVWIILLTELILAVVLVWVLAFFRDPYRVVPADKNILLAPADGKITDIEVVDEEGFIGGRALRVGIFLSILDVHINRSPCSAKVEKITYRQGRYKNAMSAQSGRVNESNDLWLIRTDSPEDRFIVRQISGVIARRIVCTAGEGQSLTGGEKFGMIKFGSRTELYLPVREDARCVVKVGDKVKAGVSVIVRYEI
ncbi:MAG: phosphatidylserine decarboxylase family protein [Planctomycetota bacterium]|nr:MAG: phosphatidylserine decarboxylase family protein [Planctomycetota bacterium]